MRFPRSRSAARTPWLVVKQSVQISEVHLEADGRRFSEALLKRSANPSIRTCATSQEAAIIGSPPGTWPVRRWPLPVASSTDEHDAPVGPRYGKSKIAVVSAVPSINLL